MTSAIPRVLGATIARTIGLTSLIAAVLTALRMIRRLEVQDLPNGSMVVLSSSLEIAFWSLAAVIFLIPRCTRRTLRRRIWFAARVASGTLGMAFVIANFFVVSALLFNLGLIGKQQAAWVFLASAPIGALYFLLFLWPGKYAADLAERFGATFTDGSFKSSDEHFVEDEAERSRRLALIHSIETRQRNRVDQPHGRKGRGRRPVDHQVQRKAVTWSLLFALVPFGIFFIGMITGGHAHFVPNISQWEWAEKVALPMSIIAGTVAGASSALDKESLSRVRNPVLRLVLLGSLCGAVALVFGKSFLAVGAPVIHSQFSKTSPSELAVVVVDIGRKRQRRSCDYNMFVQGTENFGRVFKVCNLPSAVWDRARPGTRLVLTGFETQYGFRYSAVGE